MEYNAPTADLEKSVEKLVRDLIPTVMLEAGMSARFRTAKPEELLSLLAAKLVEEANEFWQEPCIEELADVLEVLDALQREIGVSDEEMMAARTTKASIRGRFDAGLVLCSN